MKDVALTTIDNPYSPFSQFDDWYLYDTEKGYNSCCYLDRMNPNSGKTKYLTEDEEAKAIELVIDEIVKVDPTGLFVKVEKVSNDDDKIDGRDFKISAVNGE